MTSHRSASGTTASRNSEVPAVGVVSVSLEESLRPVLESMLVGLRRHRETPLLAGFDSQGLAVAALNSCSIDTSHFDDEEWTEVARALGRLVQQCLQPESLSPNTSALSQLGIRVEAVAEVVKTFGFFKPGETLDEFRCPKIKLGLSTETRLCRSPETSGLHPVAIWLELFHDVLRKVHPKGIELVALRLAGLDSRETARRLDLPHRLCERVARDVALAWAAAMEVR